MQYGEYKEWIDEYGDRLTEAEVNPELFLKVATLLNGPPDKLAAVFLNLPGEFRMFLEDVGPLMLSQFLTVYYTNEKGGSNG